MLQISFQAARQGIHAHTVKQHLRGGGRDCVTGGAQHCARLLAYRGPRMHALPRVHGVQTREEVLKQSGGDMRKAITFLQSAAALYGGTVTPENVIEISGMLPQRDLDAAVAAIKTGNYDSVRRHAQSIIASGYGMTNVLEKVRMRARVRSTWRDAQLTEGTWCTTAHHAPPCSLAMRFLRMRP